MKSGGGGDTYSVKPLRDNDIDLSSAPQRPEAAPRAEPPRKRSGKMLQQVTEEKPVHTHFSGFSGSTSTRAHFKVNNLGLRRFIAPHSKRSRRIRLLWPSYWSNWEDVQQSAGGIPGNFTGPCRKGPLLDYDRAIHVAFRGLLGEVKLRLYASL